MFGIMAGFSKGVLKSASIDFLMGDKLEEIFWFAVGDNMLDLDDDTGVLFVRTDPSSLDPVFSLLSVGTLIGFLAMGCVVGLSICR